MNSRQGALLRALLNAGDYKTAGEYGRELGCSDRTVRSDVKALNAALAREGFHSHVDRQRGAGLRIVVVPDEENRLVRLLGEAEAEMHPRYERLCQEMLALTCHPGPHTADLLARRMFRNKQQIQADLHWWQGVLELSGLSLSLGRYLKVEGPEWTIRGFVMSMLFSFPAPAVRRRILPSLVGSLDPYDRQFLERCIAEMQRDLGFEFSSNAQWQFGVYLCIMVTRIRLGHSLAAWRDACEPGPFFSYLQKRLERHFSMTVSDAEMGLLRDMANCCTWQWSLAAMEAYEPTERARALADAIASALADAFGAPVPDDMRKPLAILLESGLARRGCGLVAPNPNEEAVKYEAMDGACLLSSVLAEVPALVEADLFSPDYARLLLVLFDYLEQVGALRCYRVGLVVNCGIDLALWGAHRIEKLSSRLQVTDVLTENEVAAAAARPGSALAERFDFLVSFEPLDVKFPSVTISPAVSRADIDHIIASVPLWRRGREVRTTWEQEVLPVGPSPEGLFAALHGRLVDEGLVDMPRERFEWLLWTLSIVKDRTLVLAWCGPGVRRTGIRIFRLEEGDGAECGRCTMAAVLVVAPADRGDLTPLTQGFKRLVEDYADTSGAVNDDGFFVCFPDPE
ncbi:HTH domain-containing protein [Adlercreutzia sp. R21]|uniref:HTH domain-containing protein n=1 Tax=Adlercreutzia wanghongyangiae TaxID=3111451 RepID=UPI002DC01DFE|nr:HTH domain-containing protein [Adlercreutzia sp. R21]MEC4183744.1 HTH domain-containing protein [Adlercreutzia sp. R21]